MLGGYPNSKIAASIVEQTDSEKERQIQGESK